MHIQVGMCLLVIHHVVPILALLFHYLQNYQLSVVGIPTCRTVADEDSYDFCSSSNSSVVSYIPAPQFSPFTYNIFSLEDESEAESRSSGAMLTKS